MAIIPLLIDVPDDVTICVLPFDSEQTMDQVAESVAHHVIGRRVRPQADKILRVRRAGTNDRPFPRTMTVAEARLGPMDDVEVYYE